MRKRMLKLTGALMILTAGLTVTPIPKNAEALTCRQLFNECSATCDPQDWSCAEACQCEFLNCKGLQCN